MKIKFTILFGLLAVSFVRGQEFEVAPFVGANVSLPYYPDAVESQFTDLSYGSTQSSLFTGVNIGVQLGVELTKNFDFITGLGIAQRGFSAEHFLSLDTGRVHHYEEASLTALEAPMLLRYNFLQRDKSILSLLGGIYLGVGTTGNYRFEDRSEFVEDPAEFDAGVSYIAVINDRLDIPANDLWVNLFRFGVQAGIEYRLGKISLQAKYLEQISHISPSIQAVRRANTPLPDQKMRSIQVQVGYWFGVE